MKTAEFLDVERALQLIAQVLVQGGDDGEHLAHPTGFGELASGVELPATRASGDHQALVHRRLAIRKSLESARDLLCVAHQLMSTPESRSPKDLEARKKALVQDIRVAARRTYEAGHLLLGVDPALT